MVIDEALFTLFFSFPKCGQNDDKEKTKKDGISDYQFICSAQVRFIEGWTNEKGWSFWF